MYARLVLPAAAFAAALGCSTKDPAADLPGAQARVLPLSSRAAASLTAAQKAVVERSATLLPLAVPTIELAGGSVRCMLAGVHLARRSTGDIRLH